MDDDRGQAARSRRERAPRSEETGASGGAERPSNVTAQIPYDLWRRFQVKLLLDNKTMQQWITEEVRGLLARAWGKIDPVPYGRLSRKNVPTRQVIARIPREDLRRLKIRLAKMGIPMSVWLYRRIEGYAGGIDLERITERFTGSG